MVGTQEKEQRILSVSELNLTVRRMFEQELPPLWIQGEISNLARPASGHWYFSLKDAKAQIRCAMFRRANAQVGRSGFHPENGDQVILKGRVSLYEPRGDYQFIAEHMEEAGSGALQRAYEQLLAKLQKEGLFAQEHKQPIPSLPHCVGVITSATGAALQDIVNVMGRRMPMTPIVIYPTLVQGEQAAADILRALLQAENEQRCDLLIIGRGGGSLEDLWAFNDEKLARLAHQCSIPIISAVGHEVDFTILDFVADARAATPSAAAELASAITIAELAGRVLYLQEQAQSLTRSRLSEYQQRIDWLSKRLQLAHPGQWLQQQQQKLDFLAHKLEQLANTKLSQQQQRLARVQQGLSPALLNKQIAQYKQQVEYLSQRLLVTLESKLSRQKQELGSLSRQLNALSPLATLDRGYALVQDSSAKVITSTKQLKVGDRMSTRLKDGTIESEVLSTQDQ